MQAKELTEQYNNTDNLKPRIITVNPYEVSQLKLSSGLGGSKSQLC